MISEEKGSLKEITQKYKDYIFLFLVIIILLVITRYSLVKDNYTIYINDEKQDIKKEICVKNGNEYMHLDDVISIFKDNVYYDKISEKIIITTYDSINTIDKRDNNYAFATDGNVYLSLKFIVSSIKYNLYIQNNNIYISNYDLIQGSIIKNRTELFNKKTNNVLLHLDKKADVSVCLKDYTNSETIDVVVMENTNKYYGYVYKENITYEKKYEEKETKQKEIIVKAEDEIKKTTDLRYVSGVVLDMLRLSSENSISELDYEKNSIDKSITYAGFNISQNASNYDPDILSNMLISENNRALVIKKTISYVNKNELTGVCIDFTNFKASDKELFIQFVKEMAASIHKEGKKIIVNLPSMDYLEVLKFADYGIINVYNEKTITSKISGPISSISFVEKTINKIIESGENIDNAIIEVPAYSVLWTERKGTVINAEIYSMPLINEFVKANNLKVVKDSNNEKYINFTKGITTYKMWIEDEESVINKTNLTKKYNLAGISIYTSGMEEIDI